MFLSFSICRSLGIMALTVLMAVPCFAKREIKQWLHSETHQQAKPVQQRIACYIVCQVQREDQKENAEVHILPTPVSDRKPEYLATAKPYPVADFYHRQKEKIPSYLLFEQFLI